jgi:hypothetical protein
MTRFDIGGVSYGVLTAGKSYSLTNPDPQTLQFEVQPGDRAANDLLTGELCDRSEVNMTPALIPEGTPIAINFQAMVQPNGPNNTFTNTASETILGEMQGTERSGSPPFAIRIVHGDYLQVVARYTPPGGNPSNGPGSNMQQLTWTAPNPIVPGQYYNISVQATFSQTSGGHLAVSINGNQVTNYNGPLGYGGQNYWLYGLYRPYKTPQTVTADFRNMTLVTGSAAAGWTGVGGSSGGTSSSGTSAGTSSSGTSGRPAPPMVTR